VEKRIRKVEAPLIHDDVEVRRVPVNRVVSEAPGIRRSGDTVIVPVVEEEIVVTKRLVVKEEIHLIRRRSKERVVKEVELSRERAEVRRLDAEGRIIDSPAPRRPPGRRSVLD
jgi:stress response protein YsnF